MRPNEWAAIIFGALGLFLSCIALAKSTRSERRSKAQSLSEKRIEALLAIRDAESEVCTARRDFFELGKEATTNNDAESLNLVEEMIGYLDKVLTNIDKARTQCLKNLPVSRYDSMYATLDSVIIQMREIADSVRIKERRKELIEGRKEIMTLTGEIREITTARSS